MYIEKLVMENFRCFPGKTEIEFISGINFLVGNNNCGKTTIFKAIDFLLSGKTKDGWISKGKEDEEVSVIITLKGTDIIDVPCSRSETSFVYQDNRDFSRALGLK